MAAPRPPGLGSGADAVGGAPVATVATSVQGLRAVVSGVGAVRHRLAAELDGQGIERPMLVCGANLACSPLLALVLAAAGRQLTVYDGCRPHVPEDAVDHGVEAARRARADGLVALGGSSAVDCAKGIAYLLATGRDRVADLEPVAFGHLHRRPPEGPRATVPVVTMTTTLSFAEFLPFWGARQPATGRKLPYLDDGLVLRTVFLDGELAADTPDDVWMQTGVKALDDAISSFCRCVGPEPFLDPVLIDAIDALGRWLPASAGADRSGVRQAVLVATWMTKHPLPRLSPAAVPGWFSTAARHALGGVLDLPHGVGSCASLPAGLRFQAAATGARQAVLAGALGWSRVDSTAGAPLGPAVDDLLARLGVPTSLGPLGVDAAALDDVVAAMLAESPGLGSSADIRRACEQML